MSKTKARRPALRTPTILLLLLAPAAAQAGALELVPTRAQGMGGALRAAAAGSVGPHLNPSGMSLARSYVVEGDYHHLDDQGGHIFNATIADSTSGTNIGGGLYYTYATAANSQPHRGRHEGGVALSFPLGDRVFLGGTVKWVQRRLAAGAPGDPASVTRSGITYDAGLTIRPLDRVSLAFVGYNLRDLEDAQVPFGFAGGVALVPIPELVLAGDAYFDRRTYLTDAEQRIVYSGGAEYSWAARLSVRVGGGHDGIKETGFGTLGASLLGEAGAIDVGSRLDFAAGEAFFFGVSLRLFVPTP